MGKSRTLSPRTCFRPPLVLALVLLLFAASVSTCAAFVASCCGALTAPRTRAALGPRTCSPTALRAQEEGAEASDAGEEAARAGDDEEVEPLTLERLRELLPCDDGGAKEEEAEEGGLPKFQGLFPSDYDNSQRRGGGGIKLTRADLEPGQPRDMMGFWNVYATENKQDASDSLILRADGQVVGGPVVARVSTTWSDPAGLRPVGGTWSVYVGERGDSRLSITLIVSRKEGKDIQLDGVIMMVDTYDPVEGCMVPQPQVFGNVMHMRGVGGDVQTSKVVGTFGMHKTDTDNGGKLVAIVGSQLRRMQ